MNEWVKIMNRKYRSIEELVTKTHFDKNKPENHNIYISNLHDKYIMVHDGYKWNIKTRGNILDELYDEKAYFGNLTMSGPDIVRFTELDKYD